MLLPGASELSVRIVPRLFRVGRKVALLSVATSSAAGVAGASFLTERESSWRDAADAERMGAYAVELPAEIVLAPRSKCEVDRPRRGGPPRPLELSSFSALIITEDGEGARTGLMAPGPGEVGVRGLS